MAKLEAKSLCGPEGHKITRWSAQFPTGRRNIATGKVEAIPGVLIDTRWTSRVVVEGGVRRTERVPIVDRLKINPDGTVNEIPGSTWNVADRIYSCKRMDLHLSWQDFQEQVIKPNLPSESEEKAA